MPFCTKCGEELRDSAKFCDNCGNPVLPVSRGNVHRQQGNSKELYKCANCGGFLKSFELNCPFCGCEIREANVASSAQELALKLERIEAEGLKRINIRNNNTQKKRKSNNENERLDLKSNLIHSLFETDRKNDEDVNEKVRKQVRDQIDQQKISVIRNFPIPNTKEDLYEFFITAETNIDADSYESEEETKEKAFSEAWRVKLDQSYEKAKLLLADDPRFSEIQSTYKNIHRKVKKCQK